MAINTVTITLDGVTYASLMIAEGVPLVVVAGNLGHAQVSTTANIYAHAIKSAEAKAAQVFDRFDDTILAPSKEATEIKIKAAGE